MSEDTIAALSTPAGVSGIGIIRISGDQAVYIAANIVRLRYGKSLTEVPPFSLNLGGLIDPETGEEIDEVLVSVMRAPKTYTREDVVEINCHGGLIPLEKCLKLLIENGARIAEPGEFTKRAFLNGRLDLAQAEAVSNIIQARTEMGARAAVRQLRGSISGEIQQVRRKLIELMAYLEADVDFPEEDFDRLGEAEILERIGNSRDAIKKLLQGAEKGRLLRDGVNTVIVGKPNVGKSSILNALLNEQRAIVTEVAGTTRDAVSETINVGGVLLKIIDTAGIRETLDIVERLGVEKAEELMRSADLILFILDVGTPVGEEDHRVRDLVVGKKGIVVANKADIEVHMVTSEEVEALADGWPVLWVSALTSEGMGELEEELGILVLEETEIQGDVLVTGIRHQAALEEALLCLNEAFETVRGGLPVEISLVDIRAGWEKLGEITGDNVDDELLDSIFSQFCIGK